MNLEGCQGIYSGWGSGLMQDTYDMYSMHSTSWPACPGHPRLCLMRCRRRGWQAQQGLIPMLKVSAAELQRNIGRYQDLALTQPVVVTRNGRERTVMISIEEYHR